LRKVFLSPIVLLDQGGYLVLGRRTILGLVGLAVIIVSVLYFTSLEQPSKHTRTLHLGDHFWTIVSYSYSYTWSMGSPYSINYYYGGLKKTFEPLNYGTPTLRILLPYRAPYYGWSGTAFVEIVNGTFTFFGTTFSIESFDPSTQTITISW